ncbi:hypothetical protein C7379_12018 [Hallella colorans]|uniref:Uncharacterized protein n=1 Tax=Hallella colorans TaxID=1703337 RepID=A0A2U0U080_9BACT|nr:hypothetical protein C7379_12018 [Hallella colorans]
MKMRDGVFICQQNTIWHLRLVNPMHFDMRGNACTIKKPAHSHELAGFSKLTLII